ncbi:MAG: T9SS type A sorting domain-containing protein, partial [Parafilimonas sp.]|nr:T9SS type A sorting domain-containing protein [Parafilimonas sp.]
ITGNFYGDSLDVDPGPGMHYLHQSKNTFNQSAFVGKYKSNGEFISALPIVDVGKDYSSTEIKTLALDKSDNIYIGGKTYGNVDFDPGKNRAYLPYPQGIFFASYTNNGQLRFLKGILSHNASEYNYIQTLSLDKNNAIYAAGEFSSTDIDCDAGADSAILVNEHYDGTNNFNTDLFIAKYDTVGNYIYSYDFDGDSLVGFNQSVSIMVDGSGNINYTGFGETKLNLSTGKKKVYLQPTTGSFNFFAAQYKPAIQPQQIKVSNPIVVTNSQLIKVYPNPISNNLNVELDNLEKNNSHATIMLINMQGECLLTANAIVSNHQFRKEINLPAAIQAGNYFIKVVINSNVYYSNILLKQ